MQIRIWGETDTARLRRLDAGEIRAAVFGKRVSYNPPGTADAGANEEYLADGTWRGTRLSRGPVGFSGRWRIANGRLCTRQETGIGGALEEVCREMWRDPQNGDLLMEHMMGAGRGLLRLRSY